MTRTGLSVVVSVVTLAALWSAPPATAQILTPTETQPGDPVVATAATIGEFVATIRSGAGKPIASAHSFPVGNSAGVLLECAILGVPSTVEPGLYTMELQHDGQPVSAPRSIVVKPRRFRREEIELSGSLSELRERDDPEKVRQALRLQAIVAVFNPDSVFDLGPFRWPIPLTRRTSLFGDRRTYRYADGGRALSIHTGLDLAGATGLPVAASGTGVVRMAEARIVTGNTVVIEHLPGVFSLYYHLNELSVVEGEMVEAGDQIGTVGATGLATGPHLHWEFRFGGVSVDPEFMLNGPLVDFGL